MHILTKILVVAASLFSVMLAALTMASASNTDAIRKSFESEQRARDVAEKSLSVQSNQLQSEIARLREHIAGLNGTIAGLQTEATKANEMAANATAEKIRLQLGLDAQQGQVDQVQEMQKTLLVMIDKYRDEVTTLRTAELDFKNREIELIQIISDITGRNEVQEETIRSLKEQLTIIQSAGNPNGPTVGGPVGTGALAQRVHGMIEESYNDAGTGEQMVRISLGRNDGVEPGMKFLVLDDNNTFLCNLIVTRVDLQDSMGRIDALGKSNVQVRSGMRIMSSTR